MNIREAAMIVEGWDRFGFIADLVTAELKSLNTKNATIIFAFPDTDGRWEGLAIDDLRNARRDAIKDEIVKKFSVADALQLAKERTEKERPDILTVKRLRGGVDT